jgi:ubiquinone biosynthesis protein UbiJ
MHMDDPEPNEIPLDDRVSAVLGVLRGSSTSEVAAKMGMSINAIQADVKTFIRGGRRTLADGLPIYATGEQLLRLEQRVGELSRRLSKLEANRPSKERELFGPSEF